MPKVRLGRQLPLFSRPFTSSYEYGVKKASSTPNAFDPPLLCPRVVSSTLWVNSPRSVRPEIDVFASRTHTAKKMTTGHHSSPEAQPGQVVMSILAAHQCSPSHALWRLIRAAVRITARGGAPNLSLLLHKRISTLASTWIRLDICLIDRFVVLLHIYADIFPLSLLKFFIHLNHSFIILSIILSVIHSFGRLS